MLLSMYIYNQINSYMYSVSASLSVTIRRGITTYFIILKSFKTHKFSLHLCLGFRTSKNMKQDNKNSLISKKRI